MKRLLEFLHIIDINQPLRIQQERRGRGRAAGWLLAVCCWLPVIGLWALLSAESFVR